MLNILEDVRFKFYLVSILNIAKIQSFTTHPIDRFDSVEIGNINIQMQDLSGRRNTNDMDIETTDS